MLGAQPDRPHPAQGRLAQPGLLSDQGSWAGAASQNHAAQSQGWG